ncbi:MAG: alpha/beta fold hydrolase [Gammaproteobacteria bacterium]|jgi:pimeloyl-ACP methyl ester carboxylesterase|nr:alpha/beta fold hydrolase [Gammaproteobacteria bacterium]
MREAVVLVHGIWMNGLEFWRLRRKLERAGYECHVFKYHERRRPLAEIATRLHEFLATIDAPVVHFVGHSLGGLVLLHLFNQYPFTTKGRIVLLASPVNGSAVAKRLASTRLSRWLLGQSMEQGLDGDAPAWKGWQDIGIISGTFPMGLGLIVGGPADLPHDGTVSVEETLLRGVTDALLLPVSHFGILFSSEVAEQVITFLRAGKFDEDTVTPLPDSSFYKSEPVGSG